MTIALAIMNFYDHGATRRDFRDLAQELVQRGHQVVILSRKWHAEMLPRIHHVKISASGIGKTGKLLAFGRKVRSYCRQNSVDALIAFSRIAGADFYYLGDHAMHLHAPHWSNYLSPDFWLGKYLERKLFAPSAKTGIFALAPGQIDFLTKKYHTPEKRLELLPFGVPAESHRLKETDARFFRTSLREKYSISDREKVLLMIGSGFRNKGVDRAVTALSYLSREHLQKIRLVVCGKGSVSKMDSLARHYNVRDRVIFAENISRGALLSAADMVLCLSRREFLEETPLESISCGVPVAVTAANEFNAFVEKNGGVVLPEPFETRALAELLHRIAGEADFLDGLKQKAMALDPDCLYHRVENMADRIEAGKK